jgi:hypothetical protein
MHHPYLQGRTSAEQETTNYFVSISRYISSPKLVNNFGEILFCEMRWAIQQTGGLSDVSDVGLKLNSNLRAFSQLLGINILHIKGTFFELT